MAAVCLAGWLGAEAQWAVQLLTIPGAAPAAREYAAMAAQGASGPLLLFGGQDTSQVFAQRYFGDTWQFDGQAWTQLHPQHAPAPRAKHAMVTDWNGDILLLGGEGLAGALADAWLWNGSDWSQLPSPPSLASFVDGGLALDPTRGVVVAPTRTEVFEWDGATWSRMAANLDPGQIEGNGCFDPVRGQLLFLGHLTSTGGSVRVWDGSQWSPVIAYPGALQVVTGLGFWDPLQQLPLFFSGRSGTTTWQLSVVFPSNYSESLLRTPIAGMGLAAAFESGSGGLLLFGGTDSSNHVVASTQRLVSTSARPWSVTGYGTGCGGAAGVPELVTIPGQPPLVGGYTHYNSVFGLRVQHQAPNTWNLIYIGFGWSRTQWLGLPLPLPLDVMGGAGCSAWASGEVFANVRNLGDPSDFTYYMPWIQQAVGSHIYAQAVVFDVTAPNVIGLTASNALDIVLGMR